MKLTQMILASKHIKWCWDNEIYFSPEAVDPFGNSVKIVMIKKGVRKLGKEIYAQKEKKDKNALYQIIDNLYLKVFEKNLHTELISTN